MAVNDLRESANCRTSKLQREALTMQESTSSVKTEWMVHMEKTESNYHEDTSAVESGKKDLAEVLEIWYVYALTLYCASSKFLLCLLNPAEQTIAASTRQK
jgi:hypothetical protein